MANSNNDVHASSDCYVLMHSCEMSGQCCHQTVHGLRFTIAQSRNLLLLFGDMRGRLCRRCTQVCIKPCWKFATDRGLLHSIALSWIQGQWYCRCTNVCVQRTLDVTLATIKQPCGVPFLWHKKTAAWCPLHMTHKSSQVIYQLCDTKYRERERLRGILHILDAVDDILSRTGCHAVSHFCDIQDQGRGRRARRSCGTRHCLAWRGGHLPSYAHPRLVFSLRMRLAAISIFHLKGGFPVLAEYCMFRCITAGVCLTGLTFV